MNRINFNYTTREIMKSIFSCCLKKKAKRLKNQDDYRNHYLYDKGVKRLSREFDAINLLKLMKQVKLLVQVLLNPTQKMLLGFQRQNVIDSDSSEADLSDDEDGIQIIKKMKSQNNLIKLMTLGRVKKDLNKYFEKSDRFSLVDLRLLTGIINKRLKRKAPPKKRQLFMQSHEERHDVGTAIKNLVVNTDNSRKKSIISLMAQRSMSSELAALGIDPAVYTKSPPNQHIDQTSKNHKLTSKTKYLTKTYSINDWEIELQNKMQQ